MSQHHSKKPGILEYGSSAKHAILDEHISKSSPFVVVVVGDSVVSISVVAVGVVVVVPSSVKLFDGADDITVVDDVSAVIVADWLTGELLSVGAVSVS